MAHAAELRTRFAVGVLKIQHKEEESGADRAAEVQHRVRGMSPPQRRWLTERIDEALAWRDAYEAQELITFGRNA